MDHSSFIEALEERRLFSIPIVNPGFPTIFVRLPRTGGVAIQSGSLLAVGVGHTVGNPGLETLTIVDDGKGDVQVSWDGGPIHSFSGISKIVLESRTTVTEDVTVKLTAPLTTPLDVQLNLRGIDNTVTEQVGANGVASSLTVGIDTKRHDGSTVVTVTP